MLVDSVHLNSNSFHPFPAVKPKEKKMLFTGAACQVQKIKNQYCAQLFNSLWNK